MFGGLKHLHTRYLEDWGMVMTVKDSEMMLIHVDFILDFARFFFGKLLVLAV